MRTIAEQGSLSGKIIWPLVIHPRYTIDIDTRSDWQRAEWLIAQGDVPMVSPLPFMEDEPVLSAAKELGVRGKRPLPSSVSLVVFDFDGVMTDDHVSVDQDSGKCVMVSRSDGMGYLSYGRLASR